MKVNDVYNPICVEWILVSLDSSSHSFAALHAAVELARHYHATLKGVFIEDTTLLNLAEMPFRQEVGEYSAIVREISLDGITRGIFVQSRWVIRTFQKLINQTNLAGNFSILRGNVVETIKQESENCDLLVVGKAGTNTLRREKLGSTAKALVHCHEKSILLVEEENRLGYPMIIFYDESPVGKVSLETARELLDEGETLVILVRDDSPESFQEQKHTISTWASQSEINISIQTYHKRYFDRFIQIINGLKEGLFILPQNRKAENKLLLDYCLENVSLPILIIRQSKEELSA